MKVTVPVAVDGETVAVNPTLVPNDDGLGADVSVVMVVAWLITCETVAEVLVL